MLLSATACADALLHLARGRGWVSHYKSGSAVAAAAAAAASCGAQRSCGAGSTNRLAIARVYWKRRLGPSCTGHQRLCRRRNIHAVAIRGGTCMSTVASYRSDSQGKTTLGRATYIHGNNNNKQQQQQQQQHNNLPLMDNKFFWSSSSRVVKRAARSQTALTKATRLQPMGRKWCEL